LRWRIDGATSWQSRSGFTAIVSRAARKSSMRASASGARSAGKASLFTSASTWPCRFSASSTSASGSTALSAWAPG